MTTPKKIKLQGPPHLTHWSTALAWLIKELEVALEIEIADAARAAVRFNPLYERFIMANAITESELVGHLVGQARASVQIRETLRTLPPVEIDLVGLPPEIYDDLVQYCSVFFPEHVSVS